MADSDVFLSDKGNEGSSGSIAAYVFVTMLVGSLIVVLTSAHHNSFGRPGNISNQFGAVSSIHMLDAETGWAMTGKDRIVRTTDGGVHWKNVTPNYPATANQQSVVAAFLTASSAWVAVSSADATTTAIFRTTNAGQTWQETTIQTNIGIVAQINFVTSQDGWLLSKHAVSENAETVELFRTTDGGRTWDKQVTSAGPLVRQYQTSPPYSRPLMVDTPGQSFPIPSRNERENTKCYVCKSITARGRCLKQLQRPLEVRGNPVSGPVTQLTGGLSRRCCRLSRGDDAITF